MLQMSTWWDLNPSWTEALQDWVWTPLIDHNRVVWTHRSIKRLQLKQLQSENQIKNQAPGR